MPRTLRFRVVLLLLVAFLLSAGVFILAMNRLVLSNSERLESEAVTLEVIRVRTAVEQQVAQVSGVARALAAQSASAGGAFSENTLADLGVDFALFTDAQGRDVQSATPEEKNTLSPGARATLANAMAHGGTSGLALLPGGPAVVSSRPLPGGGTLFVGRYLQPQEDSIAKLTQSDLKLADPALRSELSVPAGESGVVAINEGVNLGWTVMRGLDGEPALLAVVKEPRPIMQQARDTLSYIQWGMALLSVLVGLSIVVMLEGSVLHRLATLRTSVIEYSDDSDVLHSVTAAGSDEIADLAVALNDTLGRMKATGEVYKHDSRHDHLTGLANRRSLEEDANRILANCKPGGHACCTLVLLDLDGFKRINDDLGHQVGDEVLVWFGQHMRECLRSDSTLCRLGGDEFGVLLPRTSLDEAAIAIERLREATSCDDDNPCFGMAQVRFSMGYAVAPDHGETLEMLMQCADTDLYANKRGKSLNL